MLHLAKGRGGGGGQEDREGTRESDDELPLGENIPTRKRQLPDTEGGLTDAWVGLSPRADRVE